jgi:acetyltransferase-like isoleucine patch superfamily enzyme
VEIYLWGNGGGASEVYHIIQDMNRAGSDIKILGCVGRREGLFSGADINLIDIETQGWESRVKKSAGAAITAGDAGLRETMWNEVKTLGLALPALIHPGAAVAGSVRFGEGCVVGPNVTISPFVTLGHGTYVSFNSSIGHHSLIGQFSVLSPGTRIGGQVCCGSHLLTGLNAVIAPGSELGDHVSVSAGALVSGKVANRSMVIHGRSRTIGSFSGS